MVNNISNFCISLICTVMMTIILEMILPEGKSKKYVTFVLGVVITITLMQPILDLMNIDIDEVLASTQAEFNEVKYDESAYANSVKKTYEESLINDVIDRLKENGYNVSNVKVEYDDTTLKPIKMYMNLESRDGFVQPVKIEVSKNSRNSSVTN